MGGRSVVGLLPGSSTMEPLDQATRAFPLFQDLFEATARDNPGSIALSRGDEQWTYAAVNAAANHFGQFLMGRGLGPGKSVAVLLRPSFEWIVTILASWKVGAAYVPLDPAARPEQSAALIEDAGCSLIIATREAANLGGACVGAFVYVEDVDLRNLRVASNLPRRAQLSTPAYIIYTSGSTGKRKGVCVPHRGLANLALAAGALHGMRRSSRTLQFSALTFDASICEITTALGTGGRLCLLEQTDLRLPNDEFTRILEERAITHAVLPPSFLERLPLPAGGALEAITSAGEACSIALARRWSACCRFINGYGPTEATVYATGSVCTSHDDVVSLGGPLANVQIHLFDGMELAPAGATGEIVIGGVGVTHGYVGLPALTARAFIPDPFASSSGARLYRTGDFARFDEQGRLLFIGRRDREIKLRGVRINLDEIELLLGRCPAIRELAVVPRPSGEAHYTQLVAFFVPARDNASIALREYAAEQLTEYQIPSLFIPLDALPLTKHGKVDRKALPAVCEALQLPAARELPTSNELEDRIAAIWRAVLGLRGIGFEQNFFDVGGNSLLLAQVQLKLREELGVQASALELLEHPTISRLAGHLGGRNGSRIAATRNRRGATQAVSGACDVAIVGVAGRFPGANSAAEFWRNLCQGLETLRDFTPDELRDHGVPDAFIRHPDYVTRGAVLDDIDRFDAAFFGIAPEEACATDPQQRLLLETSHAALEDAGYDPARYPGRIGVYAGAAENQYALALARQANGDLESDLASGLGGSVDFLALRVSYKLNLRGPSMSVQTACSTSLTAVAMACDALHANRCDMALAGGVSLRIPQVSGYWYSEGLPVSRDGHCRPFDISAGGTCFSSGVGMIVLKPLASALADNDHIYAVIRGTAINNDGSDKIAFTAPSAAGQTAVVADALAEAGIGARDIGYVEAHATGTALGDPIEVRGLTAAFRQHTDEIGFCALGSVKANIGHTNRAAGVASIIKAALALHHRQIPPSINFEAPNPALELDRSPFFVPATLRPWDSPSPRYASVNSLGAGGTNVHVVLGEAPERARTSPQRTAQLLLVSGRTKESLARNVSAVSDAIQALPENALADAAFTLQIGRAALDYRVAAVGRDPSAVVRALTRAAARPARPRRRNPRVAFMFPGHGAQRAGLAGNLYGSEPEFRTHIAMVAEILRPVIGTDLDHALFAPTPEQIMLVHEHPKLLPLMLFAIEYALAQLWLSWGIEADVVIGHSAGEYAAACIAGVFDLETALTVLRWRTDLMEATAAGAMLAARISSEDARPYLNESLSLAAVNGPQQCVFSGTAVAIATLQEQLRARDVDYRALETANRAGHSQLMDPILDKFRALVCGVCMREPRIGYVSNLHGAYVAPGSVTEPEYWVRQLRETVRFHDGLRCLLGESIGAFVEVGPPGQLSRLVPMDGQHVVVSSLPTWTATTTEVEHMLGSLGRLWTHGVAVDWDRFHRSDPRARISLPTYSFDRVRYWLQPTERLQAETSRRSEDARANAPIRDWFYAPLWRPSVAENREASNRRYLVFSDDSAVAAAILRRLGPQTRVVGPGSDFRRETERCFRARPGERADLECVRKELAECEWIPDSVLYLWSRCSSQDTPAVALAFSSLIDVAEQLGRAGSNVDLTVVTQGACSVTGHETLCPESALAAGPCLALPQEYGHISCRQVDIEACSGEPQQQRLADAICAELIHDRSGLSVAYRRGARFVLDYDRVPLDAVSCDHLPIREGGVYLVVGGTGQIGGVISMWLARRPNVRLAIVGQTCLADERWDANSAGADPGLARRAQLLSSLRAAGAMVRYYRADATNLADMTEVVARIRGELGPVNAAISCVRHPQQGTRLPIAASERERLEAIVATKARGARVLAAALEGEALDFVVLSSSLTSTLGGAGLAARAASDAYLDAFAHHAAHAKGVRYVSIGWDAWNTADAPGILPEQGLDALERILANYRLPHVAVSTTDLRAQLEHIRLPRAATPAARELVRDDVDSYVAPRTALEQRVLRLWEELLGAHGVGVLDSFFEVGGDSLAATRLARRVREHFGVHVQLREMLERPTVEGLAQLIGDALRKQVEVAGLRASAAESNSSV
jgi:polyketide synthase PksJ